MKEGDIMKKSQTRGLILDHPLVAYSVLYRLASYSFISHTPLVVFICLSEDVRNPYVDELAEAETISLENFEEKVSIKTMCLMDKNTRKQIKTGTYDFEKINIAFFSNPNQIFECFSLKEVEMVFARKSEELISTITSKKMKIAPSIAMSKITADSFFRFEVPFSFCELYKEKISVSGKKHLTIIMEHSVPKDCISLAEYDINTVNEFMDLFEES